MRDPEARLPRSPDLRAVAHRDDLAVGVETSDDSIMRKIPTVFERDWDGDRSRVVPRVHAGCEWVLAGEGVASQMVMHAACTIIDDAPRTFDALREWLAGHDIEGVVFHHPDGRMAKIKLRDFGLKRVRKEVEEVSA